jgi:hypothetical protein
MEDDDDGGEELRLRFSAPTFFASVDLLNLFVMAVRCRPTLTLPSNSWILLSTPPTSLLPATESGPPPDRPVHGPFEPSLAASSDNPRREAPSPIGIEVTSDGRTECVEISPPQEPDPSPG